MTKRINTARRIDALQSKVNRGPGRNDAGGPALPLHHPRRRINTAHKGRRLEHKTIERLERLGYDCIRAAASKGTWDVIAWNKYGLKFVQVKSNGWPGSVEMEGIILAELPMHASREVWRWDDNKREPIVRVL